MQRLAPSPSLQGWPSYGLTSLWGMLRPYASQFVFLAEIITYLKQFQPNALGIPLDATPASELDKQVRAYWPGLRHLTESIPLPSVTAQLDRIERVMSGQHSREEVIALMVALRDRLEDDLGRQLFFHVKPERSVFYNDPLPFGEEVGNACKAARDDIEAAGKCLALEQGTACVFHLMGAMEISLRSLGRALGIDYAPSWEAYIKQITTNMGVEHKKKPASWEKDEPFYRDLLGDLVAVKNAWRNPTVHVRRKYLPGEAEEVYRSVRTFMKRAATKLSDASAADDAEAQLS